MRLAALLLCILAGFAQAQDPFCSEHGVPEAVCTRCKPKLAAVFKAKGDWCAEHQLPESFCPSCHPGRGGKPAVSDLSAGPTVRLLGPEVARRVGIETVKAERRWETPSVAAVARVGYDASRVASVNARATGVVREVPVQVGSRVQSGAVLARIESTAVGADRSRLLAARARVDMAAELLERERRMLRQGITSRKDVMAAEQEHAAARAEHDALLASTGAVGGTVGGSSGYALTAPISGVVTRREVSVGQLVDTEHTLFEIVDTSSMRAEIDVPEAEAARVTPGQLVTLTFSALPGRELTATLDYVAPAVDPRSRTVQARALLANPDGVLRANMLGQARIQVGEKRSAVVVPRSALQRVENAFLVFVQKAPDRFETRRVKVAASSTDPAWVELESGIAAGDPIVTTGSFQLKTETIKGSIGAGCCEGE